MNLVSWIRENAGMFQVTAAPDPSEYVIDYGEGSASVTWSVGDENYNLDIDFKTFTAKAESFHERAPAVPIRQVDGPIYMVYGEAVNLAVQLKECADAHLNKASEYEKKKNLTPSIYCRYVGNLFYSILQGRGWATIVP